MKEQLVSFDTAKLAKEKGFDITISLIGSNHYFYKSTEELLCSDTFAKDLLYHVPTQSLLQRWLREGHGLHIIFLTTTQLEFAIQVVELKSGVGHCGGWIDKDDSLYNTYEEALEAGLFKALELIKLEK